MEIGIPQSILFPTHPTTWDLDEGSGCTEIVFNSFDTTPQSLAFPGVAPSGGLVPKVLNAGILVQQIQEDPAIRSAIDNRSHKSGGVVHNFYRGPRFTTLEAMVLGDTPHDREQVAEYLRGALQNVMDRDGRYFFKPSNAATRYLRIRHYEALKVAHSTSTTGTAVGVSAPKTALVTLVSGDWAAYTYGQAPITMPDAGTATIPNGGNTDMWPVIRVYGPYRNPLSAASIILTNHTTGQQLKMSATEGIGLGSSSDNPGAYYEIDMLNETIFLVLPAQDLVLDYLSALDPTVSDFWRIPPGGASITSLVTGTLGSTVVYARDAWA